MGMMKNFNQNSRGCLLNLQAVPKSEIRVNNTFIAQVVHGTEDLEGKVHLVACIRL